MKKDIADFVAKCPTCQQVKLEHQRPYGFLQPLPIPEWKWEKITMDFMVGLPKTQKGFDSIWVIVDHLTKSAHFIPIKMIYSVTNWDTYIPLVEFAYNNNYHSSIEMAPYEALYGRKCRFPIYWDEVGERKLTGAEIIQITSEKVSPMKGVVCFGKKGKLSSRYIGPYQIVKRMGRISYKLELPPDMSQVHPVFHISMFRKYVSDPSRMIQPQAVEVNEELSYKEKPVEIIDMQVRKLRTKEILIVNVLWRNHSVEECTWETERRYPTKVFDVFRCCLDVGCVQECVKHIRICL
ncbi:uncharacterized protein LOC126672576 [Mercurialis annua]|uniref:uncharacterized protein LOC126672576 n=1 Tax=Mercurialis annua TaxID=3986 RepID=UPI00215DF6A6|nr:uncharacterized protein LOC126672576 [Mercurialis annua]